MRVAAAAGWIALVLIYTLLTFVLSSLQTPSLFPTFQIYRIDLLLHAVEYGILAWLMLNATKSLKMSESWQGVFIFILLYCGIIGGLNELWQSRAPGRYPSLSDMVANVVGTIIVLLVFRRFKYKRL